MPEEKTGAVKYRRVYLQEPSSEDARVKTISDLRVGDWIKVQGSMQVESFINEKSEAALFLSLRIQEPWTYLTDPDDGDGNKLDSGVSTSTNANAVKDPSNVSSDDDMSSDDGTKKLKQAKSNQQARTGDKRLSDDRYGSDSNDADDETEVDKRVRMTRSIAARVYRKRPRLTHPTDPALSVIVRLDSGNTLSDLNNDADNDNDSDNDSDNNEDNAPHEQEARQGKAADSDDPSSQDDDSSSHDDDDSNDTDDTDDHERDAEDDSQGSTDDQEGDSEDDSQDSTDDQENGSGEESQSEADDQDGDSSDTSNTSQDETNDQESDSENDSSSDLDASQDEANDQGCNGGDAPDDRKDNLNADSKSDRESDETESSGSDETESDTNSIDHDDSNTETNDSDTCDSSNSNSDSQEEAVKVSRTIIETSIDGRDMDRSPPPYSLRPRSDELPLPRVGSIPEDELLVPNLVAVGMAGSTVSELVRFDDDRHGQEPQRTYHHFNGRGQGTHDGESVNENRMAYLFSQRFSDNSRREVHVLIRPAEDESVDTLTVWEKVFASDGDEAWTKLLTNE
ncbi:hypothetical protein BGX29_011539 [Mortierella sp. GBA35]|nr:hypothetical protein BGX29_011539 [Mortierella sp. GBA35]